jgi:hypothetical protein
MKGGPRSLARVSIPWTYPDASFVQSSIHRYDPELLAYRLSSCRVPSHS